MQVIKKIKYYIFVKSKVLKYWLLSDLKPVGKIKLHYPVLFSGKGKIILKNNVKLGYNPSPKYYDSYGYIEARTKNSEIVIGENTVINNGFSLVSVSKIEIGKNGTIGINFSVIDSDFHHLEAEKRHAENPPSASVFIDDNVFAGNNVTILKGVTLGRNVVVANGSIVTQSFPDNVVIGGNPAKILKEL